MDHERPLRSLSDDELLRRLGELLQQSRRAEADLVAHIGEVDERRLYSRFAAPSMFTYCTKVLHLSDAEAYLRIAAARAARRHPVLLSLLREGRLYMSGIARLAPFLTPENRDVLLKRAIHKSKRELEELIAELAPRPDVPATMRKLKEVRQELPERTPDPAPVQLFPDRVGVQPFPAPEAKPASPTGSRPNAVVQALSPSRYKVQFTASAALHDKLERLQALMGSNAPNADLAAVIEQAVTEKLERLEARRFARTNAPRKDVAGTDTSPASRHIPAAVRRAVSERDGNQCRYVDERGQRCSARRRLEYHHRHPYGFGGDHSVPNVGLLCRSHNQLLARQDYGMAAANPAACSEGPGSPPQRPGETRRTASGWGRLSGGAATASRGH